MNWVLKKFEELNIEELYKILQVRSEVFVLEQECLYQDCDGKDEISYHLFLEHDGEVLCYLRIIPRGISYDEMSIGRVLVSKNRRKKGLAREMMVIAIDFIERKLNEKSIRISGQKYLVDFYKQLGFKEVSDVYLEDGIEHVEMLYSK
ncbi:GNAT family N-acetyltransferase [Tepidibacter hydrothermalis]|uniref:GNAT family N-acetyltransferase n=1 Tax=Tepidibacter hydrothermalis TaxID=3036126 RepID=A0ABY8EDW5_9FIRM|nr:GNAT family N-acetyltransferase [Tepidibacter hydrothermalis]WFD11139.1 GNAT family N-acetyltransferase [Tepidibacter hydrothermalis]